MSSRIDGIKSRNDFAAEMGSLSGLVRSDGQRPGTPMEKLDTSQTLLRVRLMDFVSLTKPEVLLLVLIATGAGCLMASATVDPLTLFNALMGTAVIPVLFVVMVLDKVAPFTCKRGREITR